MSRVLIQSVVILVIIISVTILPLCHILFDCGCTVVDGLEHCNIQEATTPDCPWCSHGQAGFWVPFTAIVAGTVLSMYMGMRFIKPVLWVGVLTGIIDYFFWALLIGWISAVYYDYPTLLGWTV